MQSIISTLCKITAALICCLALSQTATAKSIKNFGQGSDKVIHTFHIYTPNNKPVHFDIVRIYVGYNRKHPCTDISLFAAFEDDGSDSFDVITDVFSMTENDLVDQFGYDATCYRLEFTNGKHQIRGRQIILPHDKITGEYLTAKPAASVIRFR